MKCREERYLLDGIVELDDTYLGAPTHGKKRGRGTEKVKMIVALSKNAAGNPEYVKISDVPNLKGITVGRFARDNIRAGSKIESDNARSYKKSLAQKYFHIFETYDPTSGQLNLISISNPCRGYIDVSADIITNKPDRKHHGLCLKSVRNTL
nr:transposase [Ruminococcus albus]